MEKKAEDFSNLDVEYVRGKMPVFVMKKEDGSEEIVPIDKWKTDNMVEYLTERLYKSE